MADLLNRVNNFIGEYNIPNLQSQNNQEDEEDNKYIDGDASKNKNYPFPANSFEIGRDDDGSIHHELWDNFLGEWQIVGTVVKDRPTFK